jgi:hypothetical protein
MRSARDGKNVQEMIVFGNEVAIIKSLQVLEGRLSNM